MEKLEEIKQEKSNYLDNNEMQFDKAEYLDPTQLDILTKVEENANDLVDFKCTTYVKIQKTSNPKESQNNLIKTEKQLPDTNNQNSLKKCEVCGQHLSCIKSLQMHMRIHNDENPHKCELCEKTFRQVGHLSTHIASHSKEKKHTCEVCGGSFATAASVRRHRRKIHDSGKNFNCKHCNEMFLNRDAFRKHVTEKHFSVCEEFILTN